MADVRKSDRALWISRVASLLVVVGYIIAAHFSNRPGNDNHNFMVLLLCGLPLALIWFPRQFGNYTGYIYYGYVNEKTPPVLIAIMGWFLLVGLPLILYLVFRGN